MRDFADSCFCKLDFWELWHCNLMGWSEITNKSFIKVDQVWRNNIRIILARKVSFFILCSVHLHLIHISHAFSWLTQLSIHIPHASTQLGNFNPLFQTLQQIPFLITDAFRSRHHYIFRPISFQMYWNPSCWFPRVPFSSLVMLLLICFCLSLLGECTLLFIFCLSDLCVDGIHPAHPLFFTLLWRQEDYCLVQLLKHKHH